MSDVLGQLTEAGVSVWLDDISRDRLRTGNLETLIRDFHVRGVTSPFGGDGSRQLSEDGTIGYAEVQFDSMDNELPEDVAPAITDLVRSVQDRLELIRCAECIAASLDE